MIFCAWCNQEQVTSVGEWCESCSKNIDNLFPDVTVHMFDDFGILGPGRYIKIGEDPVDYVNDNWLIVSTWDFPDNTQKSFVIKSIPVTEIPEMYMERVYYLEEFFLTAEYEYHCETNIVNDKHTVYYSTHIENHQVVGYIMSCSVQGEDAYRGFIWEIPDWLSDLIRVSGIVL